MTSGNGTFFKGNGMEEDSYRDFITGLGIEIRASDMNQFEVAEKARVSHINLSKVLNFKSGCSPRWRRSICAALGVTEEQVIARGRRDIAPAPAPVICPPHVQEEVTPAQLMSGLANVVDKLRVAEDKLRFWKDIFEYLPTPICLLRDGIVLYHNKANRDIFLGTAIGQNLCQSCEEKGYNEGDCLGCMIKDTMETGHEATFHREIQGKHYVVTTSFITVNDMSYQLVLSTQIDRCEHWKEEGANDGQ